MHIAKALNPIVIDEGFYFTTVYCGAGGMALVDMTASADIATTQAERERRVLGATNDAACRVASESRDFGLLLEMFDQVVVRATVL